MGYVEIKGVHHVLAPGHKALVLEQTVTAIKNPHLLP
jgi:hypothetical protein